MRNDKQWQLINQYNTTWASALASAWLSEKIIRAPSYDIIYMKSRILQEHVCGRTNNDYGSTMTHWRRRRAHITNNKPSQTDETFTMIFRHTCIYKHTSHTHTHRRPQTQRSILPPPAPVQCTQTAVRPAESVEEGREKERERDCDGLQEPIRRAAWTCINSRRERSSLYDREQLRRTGASQFKQI